jgi:putative SOS response-associated peptidase YedK
MCGRTTLVTPSEDLVDLFGIDPPTVTWPARYNVAPTDPVAAIRQGADGRRTVALMRWGLIPASATDAKAGARMINARAETLLQRGIFRSALASRRCLVVVDGFYEWTHAGKRRLPHYITQEDGRPMALAGLWGSWRRATGEVIETCTVVTIPATPPVTRLHDRMPLVLTPRDIDAWLDPRAKTEVLSAVLGEGPRVQPLRTHAVDPAMNNVAHDDPANIEPVPEERTLFG